MVLSFSWILIAANFAIACWAPCPEGKKCKLVSRPFMSAHELQTFANEQCKHAERDSEINMHMSTGFSAKIMCGDGTQPHRAEQLSSSQDLVELDENGEPAGGQEVTDVSAPRTECASQAECLKNQAHNLKLVSLERKNVLVDELNDQAANLTSATFRK